MATSDIAAYAGSADQDQVAEATTQLTVDLRDDHLDSAELREHGARRLLASLSPRGGRRG